MANKKLSEYQDIGKSSIDNTTKIPITTGITRFNKNLPVSELIEDSFESINTLTALSAKKGKELYDGKLDKATNVESIDDSGIADDEVVVFDLTNKKIKTSNKVFSTDQTLGSNSDNNVPTEKAVKTFVLNLTIDDVLDDKEPTKNQILKYNGSNWVVADVNSSFIFSIASFLCNAGISQTFEIGSGVWKNASELEFTATYNNGPATEGTVSKSGMANLVLANAFQGPTVNTESINYPTVGNNIEFVLNSANGGESDTETITYTFYNKRFWGVINKNTGIVESDIESLSNELSNSKGKTFTVTPGVDDYVIYAYPTRLGVATFTVGGFAGGFDLITTDLSITNTSGYTEDYTVYVTTNKNLGNIIVNVQ